MPFTFIKKGWPSHVSIKTKVQLILMMVPFGGLIVTYAAHWCCHGRCGGEVSMMRADGGVQGRVSQQQYEEVSVAGGRGGAGSM